MGGQGSKLEKSLGNDLLEDERVIGLQNYGNTCYCNSVLQALYSCKAFREHVVAYRPPGVVSGSGDGGGGTAQNEETLLSCLHDLFVQILSFHRKVGTVGPKHFVVKLKQENELFMGLRHQDAHEFLNYLINEIADTLRRDAKRLQDECTPEREPEHEHKGGTAMPEPEPQADRGSTVAERSTWIEDILGGVLISDTKCLNCESITSRDEKCLDLSVDITQNSSVTACLRNFSRWETLTGADKFHCDQCCSLQEAQKCMRIKTFPKVLALHLKRFKYVEKIGAFKKLAHRVVFPLEFNLCNTVELTTQPQRNKLYRLFAVVVHIGSGPHHGHYVALVKCKTRWLCYDDDVVRLMEDDMVSACFGISEEEDEMSGTVSSETGYILFYQQS